MDAFSLFTWPKTERAIKDLQQLLKCLICNQQSTDAQCMGSCDHSFCSSCITKLPSNSCPVCDIPSAPCKRTNDSIVNGLVSSTADLITLLNGGTVSIDFHGHEAPLESVHYHYVEKKTNKNKLKEPLANASTSTEGITEITSKISPKTEDIHTFNVATGAYSEHTKLSSKSQQTQSVPQQKSKYRAPKPDIKPKLVKKELKNSSISLTKPTNESAQEKCFGTPETQKKNKDISQATVKLPVPPIANKRNAKGETVLHSACIKGDIKRIRSLLSDGTSPNTKDNAGWTPLHEACSQGHTQVAKLLLENGAFVDTPGNNNMTPLHDAISIRMTDIVHLLRKWKASNTVRDIWGRTSRSIADSCADSTVVEELHRALDTLPDEQLGPLKTAPILVPKMVLTGSNLSQKERKNLEQCAKLIKARIVNEYSHEVTHVIASCKTGTMTCQRTIKYMMALVTGQFVVAPQWLESCLSAGGFVNPEAFEVTGSFNHPYSGTPAKSRWNASLLRPGLFSGLHVYFQGPFSDDLPSKKEFDVLVKCGGGEALQRNPNPESISISEQTVPFYASLEGPLSKCSHLCIYQEGLNEPLLKYDMPHIKTLPMAWFLECIDNFDFVTPFK